MYYIFLYAIFLSHRVIGSWASQMWMQTDFLDWICFMMLILLYFQGPKNVKVYGVLQRYAQ